MTGRRFGSQPTGPPERYGRPQRSRVQLGGSARVTSPWGPAALWGYFVGSLASLWGRLPRPASLRRRAGRIGVRRSVMGVGPHELKRTWFHRALQRAGIEHENWRPGRGVDENRRVVEAVYGYYGQLFLAHPYLLWAGMASMIGPAFYAGFRDLGFVPDTARTAVITVFGRASRRLARRAAGDLGFYETTFLTMQKKIFEDQATMHEAYLAGGLPQVEEFYRARIIDLATLQAWRQIDTGHRDGDQAAVADGNRTLLFREQHDIIDRFYVRMLGYRWPLGPAFTYLLTLAGAPSVPRAQSYPQRYPLRVDAWLPPAAAARPAGRWASAARTTRRAGPRPTGSTRRRRAGQPAPAAGSRSPAATAGWPPRRVPGRGSRG